ncbi:MAG TPA: lipopolysaccharide assembly protein LapA domain-containing protein [Nocardioides sp.]|uniref:lipopolysaccharide assembly protein LapA domain-containing protein n=1 Tax=Nocardioides sp. TaxID=35761 RepID=UPI002F40A44D
MSHDRDTGAADASPEHTRTQTKDPLRGSRTSGSWLMVVGLAVLLVLLIIFIAQNTQPADIRFLWWDGEPPQAVALLIAAAAGLVLAAVSASLRILQLRRRVRRTR